MRPAAWCKTCKQPVRLVGAAVIPEFQTAVHVPSLAPAGWHEARPTAEDPVLRAQADATEAEFPDFRVCVRFGVFRAIRRHVAPGLTAVPCAALTAGELRARLAGVTRPRAAMPA